MKMFTYMNVLSVINNMITVNTEARKAYRRKWMRVWRQKNGLVLTPEEKEKRKAETRLRKQKSNRERWLSPEGRLRAKYRMLKHRYGLSVEQANALNKVTHCPLCNEPFEATILATKSLKWSMPHVDHNHETGKVRGVLCGICNAFVGKIETKQKDGSLQRIFSWIRDIDK